MPILIMINPVSSEETWRNGVSFRDLNGKSIFQGTNEFNRRKRKVQFNQDTDLLETFRLDASRLIQRSITEDRVNIPFNFDIYTGIKRKEVYYIHKSVDVFLKPWERIISAGYFDRELKDSEATERDSLQKN